MSHLAAPFRYTFNLVLQIYIFIFHLFPSRLQQSLTFTLDLTISILTLILGRLLSDLKTPTHDLTNKIAIVTGANSGIGLQLAVELAKQNATVYIACRNASKFQSAINHITWRAPSSVGRVKALKLDTSSLDSVREFALQWSQLENNKIDILCHNAGIASAPKDHAFTPDGLETTYATNFLGSFLLTHFLEPYLSPSARVIFTSSTGQYSSKFTSSFSLGPVRGVCETGFHTAGISKFGVTVGSNGGSSRYANTKAMQVVLAKMLQRRFDGFSSGKVGGARRTAHAFTPGFTVTPIFDKVSTASFLQDPLFVILKLMTALAVDVDQGAATGVWLATTNDKRVVGPGSGGEYWDRMQERMSKADVLPMEVLERMWIRWEKDAGIEWRT